MQSLIRSKSAGVTGGRGTAGAGPGRDLLYLHGIDLWLQDQHAKHPGLVPAGIIQEFRGLCKKHTKESPCVPSLERGPGSHPN